MNVYHFKGNGIFSCSEQNVTTCAARGYVRHRPETPTLNQSRLHSRRHYIDCLYSSCGTMYFCPFIHQPSLPIHVEAVKSVIPYHTQTHTVTREKCNLSLYDLARAHALRSWSISIKPLQRRVCATTARS